jgi:uncharacterized protein (TIGR02453 family)
LVELTENNERDWFKSQQERYEAVVREPARALIRALAPRLKRVSPHIFVSDQKVGGSLMRPQRDTRFAHDKTPYKTNIGIYFRHAAGKDVHAPGLYIHLDPGEAFLGAGMWHPDPTGLAAVRARIQDKPKLWLKARDDTAFRAHFELEGESLTRVPRGVAPDHPFAADLKRKDHIGVARLEPGDLLKSNVVELVESHFRSAKPFMKFLCDALELPF